MTRPSEFPLADLLRAFVTLKPTTETSRARIAELLGMQWQAVAVRASRRPPKEHAALREHRLSPVQSAECPPPPIHAPDMASLPERDARPVLRPLPPMAAEGTVVNPAWMEEPSRLAPFDGETCVKPRVMEPLLDPRRTRALLTEALSTAVEDGPPNIAPLEDRIRRAQPVIELPRLPRRSLDSGVQVLVDRGEMLTPYHADQVALLERIRLLVGIERTAVLRFDTDPLQGAGPRGRRTWTPWTAPVPARPILLLTDLGILRPEGWFGPWREESSPADWVSFTRRAHTAGCPVVALVPYPPSRWPSGLESLLPILSWDRQLTLRDLRQTLGKRRVETG